MRILRAPTPKPVYVRPVWPNAGVQAWYYSQLAKLINSTLRPLEAAIATAWDGHLFHITVADEAIRAAGIWFATDGRHLLCHRTDGQGWAFPGGHVEPGESEWQAARREVHEELGVRVEDVAPLHANRIAPPIQFTQHGAVTFASFQVNVPEPFDVQLEEEHDAYGWFTLEEALQLNLHPGVREVLTAGVPSIVGDAVEPFKRLQVALRKWGTDTIKRFDAMALKIADDFAKRNKQATEVAMRAQLKRAGFTVDFKPTPKSVEAFRGVVKWNVDLIRSIPRKQHDQVVKAVRKAVEAGSDLHTLTNDLRRVHKVTLERAQLIARDQNAKARASIEQARRLELGITRARWRHSHAAKEPRPTHVHASETGVTYNIRKGWYDPDPAVRKHILPGELINCGCTSDAIIEGFET